MLSLPPTLSDAHGKRTPRTPLSARRPLFLRVHRLKKSVCPYLAAGWDAGFEVGPEALPLQPTVPKLRRAARAPNKRICVRRVIGSSFVYDCCRNVPQVSPLVHRLQRSSLQRSSAFPRRSGRCRGNRQALPRCPHDSSGPPWDQIHNKSIQEDLPDIDRDWPCVRSRIILLLNDRSDPRERFLPFCGNSGYEAAGAG